MNARRWACIPRRPRAGRGKTPTRRAARQPLQRPRLRPATLAVAELVEPVLVDPEIVRELVEDGDPDLPVQLGPVREGLLQRPPVDRDLRRQPLLLLEQAEEVGLVGVLVLDDDGDVLELPRDL